MLWLIPRTRPDVVLKRPVTWPSSHANKVYDGKRLVLRAIGLESARHRATWMARTPFSGRVAASRMLGSITSGLHLPRAGNCRAFRLDGSEVLDADTVGGKSRYRHTHVTMALVARFVCKGF